MNSRRGSKILPNLDFDNLDSPPTGTLSRGNSHGYIATDIEDESSVTSSASKVRRRKNSITSNTSDKNSGGGSSTSGSVNNNSTSAPPSNNQFTSPRTPRSIQPITASVLTSTPSPRVKLNRQQSFSGQSSSNNNQSTGNAPPLRRAKSVLDDDSGSVSSNATGLSKKSKKQQSGKKSLHAQSFGNYSGRKKRVSFKNPLIEPIPDTLSVPIFYGGDDEDEDGQLDDEMEKRKEKHRRKNRLFRDDGDKCGCVVC